MGRAGRLTVYSTPWCGYCHRLAAQLRRAGVSFDAVDIDEDPAAERFVRAANRGNATVPTVRFADGSTVTNPSLAQVLAKVAPTPA